jgi:UDP-3-O-[3-hydroxymyristoyl] glucosamine N-acyltransferase
MSLSLTLAEIAELTGAKLEGDGAQIITGAAGLEDAEEGDVTFLENQKYAARVKETKAAAVFLLTADASKIEGGPKNRLLSDEPRWGYAKVLQKIFEEKWRPEPPKVHGKAEVHFEARLGKDVYVGPFAVIQGRTLIGDNTRIHPQAFIGRNVRIGKNCIVHPHVFIGDYCELGDNVIINPGTVIGGDGYGYWTNPKTGEHKKIAQVGRVVIENDVEIGCNVTIDRATTGETRIGVGTKVDNLVQLGHNVRVGRNGLIVSQVGVSGSTTLGNQVVLAGQAGLVGHIKVGDGAVITAQTGIMSDVPPKAVMFGSPAKPFRDAMKIQVILGKLPEIYKSLKKAKVFFSGKKEAVDAK